MQFVWSVIKVLLSTRGCSFGPFDVDFSHYNTFPFCEQSKPGRLSATFSTRTPPLLSTLDLHPTRARGLGLWFRVKV